MALEGQVVREDLASCGRDTHEKFRESIRADYDELDGAIRVGFDAFARDMVRAEAGLRDIMPKLSEMQALLSQRGSEHNLQVMKQLGLPTWSRYLKDIAAKFNLSVRTLQMYIRLFREPKQRWPKKVEKRVGTPATEHLSSLWDCYPSSA